MAFITYPLNNIDYTAEDAELFHCTRTSGIWAENSFPISVTGADNNVTIGKGIAWINNEEFSGKVTALKSAEVFDLGIANSTYPRIDVIAIQFNANNNETDIIVKKGTPATNPVRPSIVRTGAIYELYLASVYRPAGATAITASNITDLRMDEAVCGLMADSVTKVDMTAIEAQVRNLINNLQNEIDSVRNLSGIMFESEWIEDGVIPVSKGGTNATTSANARQNINFIGENPITNDTDDTPTNWIELGTGIAHCNSSGTSMFIPTEHGILQNIVANNTIAQIWTDLVDGKPKTWKRSGNAFGWFSGWICELQIIKLWENANPSSSFAAQAISMDELMDCEFVIVEFKQKTVLIAYGEYEIVNSIGSAFYALPAMATREVSFDSAGVNFKECYKKDAFNSSTAGTVSNNTLIPIVIYGIKGVQ